MEIKKYNRIKRVLKQKKRTGKWLAEQLGKNEITVSRWCRNVQQPSLETLFEVAELLEVRPAELLADWEG
ncbi:MAG: helix-turn-helix transcriptional regulator [Lewinellaceae bacterium]|nr:helix-turn-helix transcriptional regulator [Lewinellaceae bacterium]